MTFVAYFFVPLSFPRSVALTSPLVVLMLLIAWRWLALTYLMKLPRLQHRILFLGLDESTTRLAGVLNSEKRHLPYVAVAFLTDAEDAPRSVLGTPVLRNTHRLWHHVNQESVSEIVVGRWQGLDSSCQQDLIECFQMGVGASDAGQLYEELTSRVLVAHVGADWYAELPTRVGRPYGAMKRAIDVVGAGVGLIVLAPLFLVVALLVLVDSGRPLIYRQVRLGRQGQPFTIHKFRTMVRDAETDGATYAIPHDPRSTRVGRVLRPLGLDELPQLWDVLRGRMSLVGPRPERPEFVAQLVGELSLYRARLLVRPGIVGWAEVHLPNAVDLRDHLTRLEYDLYYLKHFGPLTDLAVVLRTVWLLLSGRRWRGDAESRESRSDAIELAGSRGTTSS